MSKIREFLRILKLRGTNSRSMIYIKHTDPIMVRCVSVTVDLLQFWPLLEKFTIYCSKYRTRSTLGTNKRPSELLSSASFAVHVHSRHVNRASARHSDIAYIIREFLVVTSHYDERWSEWLAGAPRVTSYSSRSPNSPPIQYARWWNVIVSAARRCIECYFVLIHSCQ